MSCIITKFDVAQSLAKDIESLARNKVKNKGIDIKFNENKTGVIFEINKNSKYPTAFWVRPIVADFIRKSVYPFLNLEQKININIVTNMIGTFNYNYSVELKVNVPDVLLKIYQEKNAAKLTQQVIDNTKLDPVEKEEEPMEPQNAPNKSKAPDKIITPRPGYKGYPNVLPAEPFVARGVTIVPWGNQYMFEGEVYPTFQDAEAAQRRSLEEPSAPIKEGVPELFESNPELATIGTQQQYSQYLDTIFPNSQVKSILYHGTNDKELQTKGFSEEKVGTGWHALKELYFTFFKEYTKIFGGNVIRAIVNATNPETFTEAKVGYSSVKEFRETMENARLYISPEEWEANKYEVDSIIGIEARTDDVKSVVVFDYTQAHVLGSNQDIEGFKKFVAGTKVAPAIPNKIEEEPLDIDIQDAIDTTSQIDSGDLDDIGFEGEVCGI